MDAAEPAVVSGKDAGYGRNQGVCGSSFQNQGAGEGETEMVVVREGERARGLKSGMFGHERSRCFLAGEAGKSR